MNVLFRGGTVLFSALFFDQAGEAVQPTGAVVSLVFPLAGGAGEDGNASVDLESSDLGTPWTGQWDSRVAAQGTVFWSLHTTGDLPIVVKDGRFSLSANVANVV